MVLQALPPVADASPDLRTVLLLLGAVAWAMRELYTVFNKPTDSGVMSLAVIKEQVLPILLRQTEILGALQQGQAHQREHEIREMGMLEQLSHGIDHVRASQHVIANTEQAVVLKLEQLLRAQEKA